MGSRYAYGRDETGRRLRSRMERVEYPFRRLPVPACRRRFLGRKKDAHRQIVLFAAGHPTPEKGEGVNRRSPAGNHSCSPVPGGFGNEISRRRDHRVLPGASDCLQRRVQEGFKPCDGSAGRHRHGRPLWNWLPIF